ncbi:MAG: nucleotidyltransferase family protein [Planctomycetales bacterium]|nr:nucleotidyltransferase family protein [Planctomycetales bacterium]
MQNRIDELVQQPLDWAAVLKRSWWHRIRPLTFHHVDGKPSSTMPEDVRAAFVGFVEELAERNRRLSGVLSEVSTVFEDAQIRGLVFKGPTLAEDAYGDLTLRECGDLDLLIDQQDFDRVRHVLVESGFVSCWDSEDNNRQVFACEFERPGASLDVHWDLAPGWLNYQVHFDRLWDDGVPLSAKSSFLRKLRPEDSASVLCIHGTKHWWERLRWICDVAELVNSGRITDWDRVETTAIEARCHRSVSLGLYLAGNLLDAKLPVPVSRRLAATPGIRRLGAQVRNWLQYAESSKDRRRVQERFLFRMGVCERARDRIPQIIHYLFARPHGS